MSAFTFLEELKAYRDPTYGLLGDGKHPTDPSGNSLLYESHAAIICQEYRTFPWDWDKAREKLLTPEGLLRRKPHPFNDDQAHDDYTGAAAVDLVTASNFCRHMHTHGAMFDWKHPDTTFWQTIKDIATGVKPISYLKYWHGRLPGQVAHYKIGSWSSAPSIVEWLMWLGSIMWTIRKPGNTSGWLLDYLKLRTALARFPNKLPVRLANWFYKRQLNKYYGGNIKGVYAVYFGPEHPIARYASWP